jgi:hypothetical protein
MGVAFSARNMPTELGETRPMTPASSKASLAAVSPKLIEAFTLPLGIPPSFGSFFADEQDLEVSVLKAAIGEGPGLQHRRSPLHRGRGYGRPHHLCQKRRRCGPSLERPVAQPLRAFPRLPQESFRAGIAAILVFQAPYAIIHSLRFAEFGEFYDLGLFCRHVSSVLDSGLSCFKAGLLPSPI